MSARPALIAAAALLLMGRTLPALETDRPPNIVLILSDDLGAVDLGCDGADLHETPNLDRLARQGVRFTRAYAMSVCTPTRASILTGKHAARLHMTVWREAAVALQSRVAPPDQKLIPPAPTLNLPRAERTAAEVLRDRGYLTLHVGKWHLGDSADFPEVHGFDVNVGGNHWGAPATYFHPFRGGRPGGETRYVGGLGIGQPGDYLTDRLTDEAIRLIDAAGDRPFFLNLWHHAVHTPIQAKPERVAEFAAAVKPGMRHRNPTYAAMLAALDDNVGRLLRHLEERGLDRNTLVIFTSDNGGYLGPRDGPAITDNTPLRSGKGSLYEGGVRVPLIVRWPGVTPPGSTCDRPVTCADWWATLIEAGGEPNPGPSDGLSLVPLLKDPAAPLPRDTLFFHYPHYYPTASPSGAIRSGRWKLIEFFEDRRAELYDLAADPTESRDLAADRPEVVEDLRKRLQAWRAEVGAQMPEPNPAHRGG